MKSVLLVLRDTMTARMILPVAALFRARGVAVSVIAEGRAVDICRDSGIATLYAGDSGNLPFSKIGTSIDSVLESLAPDVVCVGTSIPNNWEVEFAKAGTARGIPVAVFSDTWGGLQRLQGVKARMAFVVDQHEKDSVDGAGLAQECVVIGDIASTFAKVERTSAIDTRTSILAVGDDPATASEIIETVGKCIRLEDDPGRFVLIPRLMHPKYATTDIERDLASFTTKALEGLPVNALSGVSTDALAARADYTVACFSTSLRVAIHHGRRGVSVATSGCMELLKRETGNDEYPLVRYGVIPAVVDAQAFTRLDWRTYESKTREWAAASAFTPDKAADALFGLLG